MGAFFTILRTIGLGVLGFISPVVLVSAGVPLDVWAQEFGLWIGGAKAVIPQETWLTILGVIFAVILITAELWFHIVQKILSKILPPAFNINLEKRLGEIGNAEILCAVSVRHNSSEALSDCLVQIDEIDELHNNLMPVPFVLRTEGQIRNGRKGRFKLTPNQPKKIPVFSKISIRRDEWRFVDENKKQYCMYPSNIKMIIGIYGGNISKKILLEISKTKDWKAKVKIKMVRNKYSLRK